MRRGSPPRLRGPVSEASLTLPRGGTRVPEGEDGEEGDELMEETVQVPVSFLEKLAQLRGALQDLEDDLEDYLISQNEGLLERLREARADDEAGNLRSFSDIEPTQ